MKTGVVRRGRVSKVDWPRVLADAVSRGMTVSELAAEIGMSVGGTEKATYRNDVHLGKGRSIPRIGPDSAYVPLANGEEAIVSLEDVENVCAFRWRCSLEGYAVRNEGTAQTPSFAHISMHRQVMGFPEGVEVDHRNRNRLDNRRTNLRLASNGEQADNASLRSDNKSGYKGVIWHKRDCVWIAYTQHRKRRIQIGRFTSVEEAAEAYRSTIVNLKGEFACPDKRT